MSGNVNFIGTQEEWDALVEKNKLRLLAMKKQTAVEWLVEQINQDYPEMTWAYKDECDQALAMEKEQIKYAFGQGSLFDPVFPDQFHYRADDYYQKHYGQ